MLAVQLQLLARQSAELTAPDNELLRRFSRSRDEAAFAELVRRHGSLVMGVGRRMLGDHHAAEDVLQATFLLLARKAGSQDWKRTVGPWLYAVAFRLARKTRRRKPPSIDTSRLVLAAREQSDPLQPLLWQEVQAALDEELARLSESVRSPLVLCYLQGRTRDEAAHALGWTLATLKRRLERGRNLLRARLTRRGLTLSAVGGAALLDRSTVSAELFRRLPHDIARETVPASAAALLGNPLVTWKKLALAMAMLTTMGLGASWVARKTPALAELPPIEARKPESERLVRPRLDVLGDPLPDGAISRLGTTRLRPGRMIQAMEFSPYGKQLAIWGHSWFGNSTSQLIFADPMTGQELKSIALPRSSLRTMRWLANGKGLAFVKINQGEYLLWEFTDPNASLPVLPGADLNSSRSGDICSAAISPDGRWFATGRMSFDGKDQPIELWEARSNARLADLKPRELGRQSGPGLYVVFSADSKLLFALTRDQEPSKPGAAFVPGKWAERAKLVVYDVTAGKSVSTFDVAPPLDYYFHSQPAPERIALSVDGKTLLIGDESGTIHAYDWAAGKELHSRTGGS